MNDKNIEQEIQAKGKTAPRITPDHIESVIVAENYFTAADGVLGAYKSNDDVYVGTMPNDQTAAAHPLLTFCVLVLKNGFTVTGESACASPENLDEEIGRKIARANAVEKIWAMEGYLLKQKLSEQSNNAQLVEYIKQAIGEGYQPEHISMLDDLTVIDRLGVEALNREYGKCWQWYNLGGGQHETYQQPQ